MYIEELTRVVISYEIYETSFRRVFFSHIKMTMSVRFCLSYGLLKCDSISLKMKIISIRNRIVDMDVVNGVTCTRPSVIKRVIIRFLG